jgi:predicted ribosome quality control (RQC) complex YloA/Tae2 family protein
MAGSARGSASSSPSRHRRCTSWDPTAGPTFVELYRQREQEERAKQREHQEKEKERLEKERERHEKEKERQEKELARLAAAQRERAERLAAQLRALGIEPEA